MAELKIVLGDITTLKVDAIVNAANDTLLGGSGVDGAIHKAAGPELLEACRPLDGCLTGDAKITPGFKLPARWVIHAVGPKWFGGFYYEAKNLASCYIRSLELASEKGLASIAFPCISTGVFNYPLEEASQVAVAAVREFLAKQPTSLKEVIFCCFTQEQESIYKRLLG